MSSKTWVVCFLLDNVVGSGGENHVTADLEVETHKTTIKGSRQDRNKVTARSYQDHIIGAKCKVTSRSQQSQTAHFDDMALTTDDRESCYHPVSEKRQ